VVGTLALMWFVGETIFIHKKAKQAKLELVEQAEITKARLEANHDETNGGARRIRCNAAVPGGRHRDDSEEITYPASWGFQLDQWRARKAKVKKETEGLSMRVLAIYIVFFILGSLVVMFFLVMTPQPPTEDEEAEDLANWQFYVNPFYKAEQLLYVP